MNKFVEDLEKEKEVLQSKVYKINDVLKGIRELCTHKDDNGNDMLLNVGNDSHKTWYRCDICGYDTWV